MEWGGPQYVVHHLNAPLNVWTRDGDVKALEGALARITQTTFTREELYRFMDCAAVDFECEFGDKEASQYRCRPRFVIERRIARVQ